MQNPKITISDSNGTIEREMNSEELAYLKTKLAETEAEQKKLQEAEIKKAELISKLELLGLTLDDIKLLGLSQ